MARMDLLGIVVIGMAVGCGPNGSPPSQPWPFDSRSTINTPKSDETAVRAVYEHYQSAIQDRSGPAIAACLTRASHDRLAAIRTDALEMKRPDLEKLARDETFRVFLILRMRLEWDADTLRQWNLDDLLSHCTDRGWFEGELIKDPLHAVRANPKLAHATLYDPSTNIELERFEFVKESDGWKVDWTHSISVGNKELAGHAIRAGKSPIDFLRERFTKSFPDGYWKEKALEGPLEKE